MSSKPNPPIDLSRAKEPPSLGSDKDMNQINQDETAENVGTSQLTLPPLHSHRLRSFVKGVGFLIQRTDLH